jgi:hypothetical protein
MTGFQIVELILDPNQNVVERKAMSRPYPTREEAIAEIESVLPIFASSGYEPKGDFWWAVTQDGKRRLRWIIETV